MDFRFSLVEPLLPPFPSKTTTLPRASEPSTTGAQRQANGMSCRLAEAASVVMATCHKWLVHRRDTAILHGVHMYGRPAPPLLGGVP